MFQNVAFIRNVVIATMCDVAVLLPDERTRENKVPVHLLFKLMKHVPDFLRGPNIGLKHSHPGCVLMYVLSQKDRRLFFCGNAQNVHVLRYSPLAGKISSNLICLEPSAQSFPVSPKWCLGLPLDGFIVLI